MSILNILVADGIGGATPPKEFKSNLSEGQQAIIVIAMLIIILAVLALLIFLFVKLASIGSNHDNKENVKSDENKDEPKNYVFEENEVLKNQIGTLEKEIKELKEKIK